MPRVLIFQAKCFSHCCRAASFQSGRAALFVSLPGCHAAICKVERPHGASAVGELTMK